jgi:hypothetical protein
MDSLMDWLIVVHTDSKSVSKFDWLCYAKGLTGVISRVLKLDLPDNSLLMGPSKIGEKIRKTA